MMLPACSNDVSDLSSETSDTELATVNIHVSTRANDGTDSNMDADEGIKTLRIIVLDENWKILENWYQEGLGGTEGKTEEQAITMQLPRTKVRFLAIANEKSMGRSFDTETLMADNFFNYATNGLKNIFNRAWDDATPFFPKTAANFITTDVDDTQISDIVANGLPMTGIVGGKDIITGDGSGVGNGEHHDYNQNLYQDRGESPINLTNINTLSLEIPLVRCVSKLVVNVTNAMDEDLTIKSVRFGRFFTNKVYYYAHDPLHLPFETSYNFSIFRFTTPITIQSNEKQNIFIGYFYPVALPNNNETFRYSIALESNVAATSTYHIFLPKKASTGTTDIGRNKLVKVDCTVNVKEFTVNNLILIVDHWDDAGDMDDIVFN